MSRFRASPIFGVNVPCARAAGRNTLSARTGRILFHSRYLFAHTTVFHATGLRSFASNRRKGIKDRVLLARPVSWANSLSSLNAASSSACFLHATGFVFIFLAADWLREITRALQSHPAGLPADHHGNLRVCVCGGRPGSFSRHPGPHLPDSRFRISCFPAPR